MSVKNKVVLVSGANRGIGLAIVKELLKADVAKVYTAARRIASLPDFSDTRAVPLQLDLTDQASVDQAAAIAGDIDILVNNAATLGVTDFITTPLDELDADMRTNFYGTLRVIRAFTPALLARGSGTIVNVVSISGLVATPPLSAYAASKAALHSLTQTLRMTLKKSGIDVIGVYPGPVDTEMAKDIPLVKASPAHVAANIIKGIANGETYIFPDPTALQMKHLWENEGRRLEDVVASMLG
jgi:NAD(P)-dependent dehydrogenase (short-subunit alcohol dehydrogenase family)